MNLLKSGFLQCLVFALGFCEQNLYDVIGVRKTATQKEIRDAYKQLARDFHPDKSNEPDATEKFTKINEAYETLRNTEKRREYDDFGYTAGSSRQQQRRQHHGFEGFESFFGHNGGFNFNFGGGGGESFIDKHLIYVREYDTTILPNSNKKPCVIYLFTDYCFNCMRVEGIVEKFMQESKAMGLCVAAVHANRAGDLASKLRVSQVPSIVGVLNERLFFFRGGVSGPALRDFTRNMFPTTFVVKVTDQNLQQFLDGWADNRVRAIFFSPREEMFIRFLTAAYYYRDNVAFSYVFTRSPETASLIQKYNINRNRETLLMFNEESYSPVATISMQQLSRSSLDEVIEGNKFLMLPRLSNQRYFEELCPETYKVKNRKLCVVLITKKTKNDNPHRDRFRKFSQRSPLSGNSRIQFAYMYEDTQQDFVKSLTKGKQIQNNDNEVMVAIIWRIEKYQMKYEWLETGWDIENEKYCGKALETRLNVLLTTDSLMPYKTTPPKLYNEHGLGLLTRIGHKLVNWAERIWAYFSFIDSTSWVTIGLSLTFVFGMGYFMHKLATLEEIQVQNSTPQVKRPRPASRTYDEKTMKLYELDYKSYEELVSEADTGLTITILVDKDTKDQLVKQFAKICHSYSRYSGLTFAFLQLEYNIEWYRSLLQASIDDMNLDKINIKNCIGTVLALNGYRKYYYIYSAKRTRQFIRKRNNVSEALGLDDLDEISDSEDKKTGDYFFVDELLDGLNLWMDKIFDGSIKRIRITKWPEMPK